MGSAISRIPSLRSRLIRYGYKGSMSFITKQGLALTILGIALAMPGIAEAVSYEVQLEVPEPYRELLQNNIDIYKWRDNPRLTEGLWRSLYAKAPEQIKRLMATEGYYTPAIISSLEQKAEKRIARFSVAPGEPTTVDEVDLRFSGAIVEQDPKLEPSIPALRNKWPLKRGDIFRQAAWESAKRAALRDLLINRYPTAIISSSQARVDPKTRKAALHVSNRTYAAILSRSKAGKRVWGFLRMRWRLN
jgi:translocation and assembly module TamA